MSDRDWDTTQRAEVIWERLDDHLSSVGVLALRVAATGPYGYGTPQWGPRECWIELCPERIAETTGWLNEFDLDEYIGCLEVMIDYQVAHHAMDAGEAEVWFLAFMKDEAPGTLRLMLNVQERSDA